MQSATTIGSTLPGSESYAYAVPILRLPGRGLDLDLTLYYSSAVWTVDPANLTITLNADRDWPSYGFRLGYGFIELSTDPGTSANTYTVTEADGSKRILALVNGQTTIYESSDNTFTRYDDTPAVRTLTYKDGTTVKYEPFPGQTSPEKLFRPTRITDTNGNYISISYLDPATYTWAKGLELAQITDTLGRNIVFSYNADHTLFTITYADKTFTFYWTPLSLRYTFTGYTVKDSPDSGGSSTPYLTKCVYPNGTSYVFKYGGQPTYADWGIVNRIENWSAGGSPQLRSYVSYNYPAGTTPSNGHPTYTQQTVNNGSTSAVWTYAVTKSSGVVTQMTVTDPIGTVFKTNFSSDGLMSSIVVGSTALRTTAYTWTAGAGNNPAVSNLTTTLNDSGQQSKVVNTYDSYGNTANVKEYDYGLLLKRETVVTYLTTSGYLARRILDRPTSIQVKDGTGALQAQTDLAYDGSSLSAVTGAVNHDDANFGSSMLNRGNLTSTTRYSGVNPLSGSVTRNLTYNTLGGLTAVDLDCCVQRTLTYNSTTQYAFPVSTVSGSGDTVSTSTGYDTQFRPTSSTDENGIETDYAWDSSDRLTSVVRFADSSTVSLSYDDQSLTPRVTRTQQITASTSAVQISTADGLGRVTKNELKDGSSNLISQVDMGYDSLGRRTSATNPYKSPEAPSCATNVLCTTYSYDAINRVTKVIPPGGTSSSNNFAYSHSGNAATLTDPAGKQRKNYADALGRLVRVDEPGDGTVATGTVTVIQNAPGCASQYQNGTVSMTVHGFTATVPFTSSSTSGSVGAALRDIFNNDVSSPVTATFLMQIALTTKDTGTGANYTVTSTWTYDTAHCSASKFTISPATKVLSGGTGGQTISLTRPFATFYYYDVLDDLLKVEQGVQERLYIYDAMGRLLQVKTPETAMAATTYSYNTSGTVATRLDPKAVTTTYNYDGLNRLKWLSYDGGTTKPVQLTYESGKARLSVMDDSFQGIGSETYSYDPSGRTSSVAKVISNFPASGSTTYTVSYGYNLADELTSITYPNTGYVANYAYDGIGRLFSLNSTMLSGITYNSASLPTNVSFGNGVKGCFGYTDRLLTSTIKYATTGSTDCSGGTSLLNLTYTYASGNNGQIAGITDAAGNTRSTQYTYDQWSRLKTAKTVDTSVNYTWSLSNTFDRYGNRTNQALLAPTAPLVPPAELIDSPSYTISATTNRITTSGFAYDANGNMTQGVTAGSHTFGYDNENRLTVVDSGAATYAYDGNSLRVKKIVGSTATIYVFSGAKLIQEYSAASPTTPLKQYVYAGEQRVATLDASNSVLAYDQTDHLSLRVQTNTSGTSIGEYGHASFGEVWYEPGSNPDRFKFTTYDRDSAAGLDYAIMRWNSRRMGRFSSPDPLAGSLGDPQSLNRYAYTRNDPINLVDPLGLTWLLWCHYQPLANGTNKEEYCWWEYQPDLGAGGGTLMGGGGGGGGRDAIGDRITELLGILDPACIAWLNSQGGDVKALLAGLVTAHQADPSLGYGTVAVMSQPGETIPTAETGGFPVGTSFTVNLFGGFYSGSYNGRPITVDRGNIPGGTRAAQLFVILHETSHLTEVATPDRHDQGKIDKNDKTIEKKCKETMKKIKSAK